MTLPSTEIFSMETLMRLHFIVERKKQPRLHRSAQHILGPVYKRPYFFQCLVKNEALT